MMDIYLLNHYGIEFCFLMLDVFCGYCAIRYALMGKQKSKVRKGVQAKVEKRPKHY